MNKATKWIYFPCVLSLMWSPVCDCGPNSPVLDRYPLSDPQILVSYRSTPGQVSLQQRVGQARCDLNRRDTPNDLDRLRLMRCVSPMATVSSSVSVEQPPPVNSHDPQQTEDGGTLIFPSSSLLHPSNSGSPEPPCVCVCVSACLCVRVNVGGGWQR